MAEIQIEGMDRLLAEELVELAKAQGIPGVELVSSPDQTGRLGTLDQVVAHIPDISDLIPILLTAWIMSAKTVQLRITRRNPHTKREEKKEFKYTQADPSKVLKELRAFFGL